MFITELQTGAHGLHHVTLPTHPVDGEVRDRRGFLARYNAVEVYQERTTVALGQARDEIALDQQALFSSFFPRQTSIGCIACFLT
jgi:hypothetical protein